MRYVYLGDALTRPALRGAPCDPVMRTGAAGRPVVTRGRNRNQLVTWLDGTRDVVPGRHLRLASKRGAPPPPSPYPPMPSTTPPPAPPMPSIPDPPGGWEDFVSGLRAHMGLNQTDFGVRLNVRQATVSDWENGKNPPTGPSVVALKYVARESGYPDDARRTRLREWVEQREGQ